MNRAGFSVAECNHKDIDFSDECGTQLEELSYEWDNIKVVAFDFDGVLVDSLIHNLDITNSVCKEFGAKKAITVEDLQQIDAMSFDAVARFMGVPEDNFEGCLKIINKHLVDTYDQLLPFDGIDKAIEILHNSSMKLIIVTHNTEFAVSAFLKNHNLLKYFTMILGTETLGDKDKKLLYAMDELNVSPNEIVMIGDSVGDITKAIDVDVIPIGVSWGFQKAERLSSVGAKLILQKTSDIAIFANHFAK